MNEIEQPIELDGPELEKYTDFVINEVNKGK